MDRLSLKMGIFKDVLVVFERHEKIIGVGLCQHR